MAPKRQISVGRKTVNLPWGGWPISVEKGRKDGSTKLRRKRVNMFDLENAAQIVCVTDYDGQGVEFMPPQDEQSAILQDEDA